MNSKLNSNVKKQLIESVKAIKSKAKRLREEENNYDMRTRKMFKAIVDPLDTLVTLGSNTKSIRECSKGHINKIVSSIIPENDEMSLELADQDCSNECISKMDYPAESCVTPVKHNDFSNDLSFSTPEPLSENNSEYRELNIPFGIRSENNLLLIGNTVVSISGPQDGTRMIRVGDKKYMITPGIEQLLLKSKPELKTITESDKIAYKEILRSTNAHKRDFNPSAQIKGDKGIKYCKIIRPLFSDKNVEDIKQGGYLRPLKKYKKNTDYVYWDDPNELIERLKILIASKDAGNTSHNNEIISIIEELKEAGIIKK